MKKIIYSFSLLLLCSFVYLACKKSNDVIAVNNADNMSEYNALIKQITEAKSFFLSNVDTNAMSKFKKTALWNKAYIAHFKKEDKIIIPLKYEKNYTFNNLFCIKIPNKKSFIFYWISDFCKFKKFLFFL